MVDIEMGETKKGVDIRREETDDAGKGKTKRLSALDEGLENLSKELNGYKEFVMDYLEGYYEYAGRDASDLDDRIFDHEALLMTPIYKMRDEVTQRIEEEIEKNGKISPQVKKYYEKMLSEIFNKQEKQVSDKLDDFKKYIKNLF